MQIGLISDTHSFLDPKVKHHFELCDEIWHAGDIGTLHVAEQLAAMKPLRAVYGNIDAPEVRHRYPEHLHFNIQGLTVWITHIGGYPPRYTPAVKKQIRTNPPNLFICGHSHILKVMKDPNLPNTLHMNPGAAGQQGFHKFRTLLRFTISEGKIGQVEAIELGKRGK